MKLAFLTMVWRDYWLLEKWVTHNEKTVPRRQLYVINHGGDPEVDRIADGCNVIHVPRDEVTPDLTRRRWDLKGAITNGLLSFHDAVITTDVDEFLVYAGEKAGLVEHLATAERFGNATAPVGLNVIPTPQDPKEESLPVLARHPHALVHGKYTKPCIAHNRVVFTTGGHGLQRGDFRIDPDILLFHLHYVTPDYRERMAARQDIVQQSKDHAKALGAELEQPKRYWINWAKPDQIRDKDFGNFERAEAMDVSKGFAGCAEVLLSAKVSKERQTVVDPRIVNKQPRKVTLPKAFQSAI